MNIFFDTFPTPMGPFSAAVNAEGELIGTAFGTVRAFRRRIPKYPLLQDSNRVRPVRDQILAFFAGERREFDLPLAAVGTTFQRRVWTELQRIPFGHTRTYAQIASAIGQPGAARAVGRANATNPICLIVPCHRVIGSDHSLTGFAFGEEIKRRLLEHERERADLAKNLEETSWLRVES